MVMEKYNKNKKFLKSLRLPTFVFKNGIYFLKLCRHKEGLKPFIWLPQISGANTAFQRRDWNSAASVAQVTLHSPSSPPEPRGLRRWGARPAGLLPALPFTETHPLGAPCPWLISSVRHNGGGRAPSLLRAPLALLLNLRHLRMPSVLLLAPFVTTISHVFLISLSLEWLSFFFSEKKKCLHQDWGGEWLGVRWRLGEWGASSGILGDIAANPFFGLQRIRLDPVWLQLKILPTDAKNTLQFIFLSGEHVRSRLTWKHKEIQC